MDEKPRHIIKKKRKIEADDFVTSVEWRDPNTIAASGWINDLKERMKSLPNLKRKYSVRYSQSQLDTWGTFSDILLVPPNTYPDPSLPHRNKFKYKSKTASAPPSSLPVTTNDLSSGTPNEPVMRLYSHNDYKKLGSKKGLSEQNSETFFNQISVSINNNVMALNDDGWGADHSNGETLEQSKLRASLLMFAGAPLDVATDESSESMAVDDGEKNSRSSRSSSRIALSASASTASSSTLQEFITSLPGSLIQQYWSQQLLHFLANKLFTKLYSSGGRSNTRVLPHGYMMQWEAKKHKWTHEGLSRLFEMHACTTGGDASVSNIATCGVDFVGIPSLPFNPFAVYDESWARIGEVDASVYYQQADDPAIKEQEEHGDDDTDRDYLRWWGLREEPYLLEERQMMRRKANERRDKEIEYGEYLASDDEKHSQRGTQSSLYSTANMSSSGVSICSSHIAADPLVTSTERHESQGGVCSGLNVMDAAVTTSSPSPPLLHPPSPPSSSPSNQRPALPLPLPPLDSDPNSESLDGEGDFLKFDISAREYDCISKLINRSQELEAIRCKYGCIIRLTHIQGAVSGFSATVISKRDCKNEFVNPDFDDREKSLLECRKYLTSMTSSASQIYVTGLGSGTGIAPSNSKPHEGIRHVHDVSIGQGGQGGYGGYNPGRENVDVRGNGRYLNICTHGGGRGHDYPRGGRPRSRSREREREREWERDRDRERERDSETERDRDWDREWDRETERDRDREWERGRDRDREWERSGPDGHYAQNAQNANRRFSRSGSRDRDRDHLKSFTLTRDQARTVIGVKGVNIRSLRDEYYVNVQIDDNRGGPPRPSYIFPPCKNINKTVTGKYANLMLQERADLCFAALMKLVDGHSASIAHSQSINAPAHGYSSADRLLAQLPTSSTKPMMPVSHHEQRERIIVMKDVPRECIGTLIGPKGSTIQALSVKHCVHIQVFRSMRAVEITPGANVSLFDLHAEACHEEIRELIQSSRVPEPSRAASANTNDGKHYDRDWRGNPSNVNNSSDGRGAYGSGRKVTCNY